MAAWLFLTLSALILSQGPRPAGDGLDEETRVRMREREEMLKREMIRLLQEMEQKAQEESAPTLRTPEQSGFAWEALLFAALQQWQLWAVAAALLLLCGLCWRLRKRSCWPAISRKEGSSGNMAVKEKQEEKASVAPVVIESFTTVEELVLKLLHICRKLGKNSCVPRLRLATVLDSTSEMCGSSEGETTYHFLVHMQPAHGHAFHVEMGTVEGMYRLCAELKCTCTQHMLCFLHHPEKELRKKQGPSLLDTFCIGPYLDIDKTYLWFQTLVNAAWALLPESRYCQLLMLPSSRSCKLRLTCSSGSSLMIELTLGVQNSEPDTFITIEDTFISTEDIFIGIEEAEEGVSFSH